eukprot:m.104656 g.104656  ORF g.104656 m.104656 type:complete len:155 (+) comp22457_c1_seq7:1489-1953(+)
MQSVLLVFIVRSVTSKHIRTFLHITHNNYNTDWSLDPLPWLSGDKIATGIKSTPTFLTEPPPEQSQSPFARLEDIRRRLTKFSNERQASSPPHSFSEKTPQDDYNSYTSFSDASISESISEQLSKLSANDDTADFSILSTQSHREYDYGEPVQK